MKIFWYNVKRFAYYLIGKPYYQDILIPKIRRSTPTLITNDLASVQPIQSSRNGLDMMFTGNSEKSIWDIIDEYYNKIGISKSELLKRIENSTGVYINYFDGNIDEWNILGHIKQNKFLLYKKIASNKLEFIETAKLVRASMFHSWIYGYIITFLTDDGKEIRTLPLWELKKINVWRNDE